MLYIQLADFVFDLKFFKPVWFLFPLVQFVVINAWNSKMENQTGLRNLNQR